MPRFAAFLRGVSSVNARMADLASAFESAGFTDVRTVLSSGNVVFTSPDAPAPALQGRAEAAMKKRLGREFLTIVRPIDALRALLASDPFRTFHLAAGSKRIVTFLREAPAAKLKLPVQRDGARILSTKGGEIFSAYVPNPKGPIFMTLIEKTFGKEQTTRTWETVAKVAR